MSRSSFARAAVRALVLMTLVGAFGCMKQPPRDQQQAPRVYGISDSGFTVRPLAPGVYAVTRNEPLGLINESNALFIIGDRGVTVVDAQSSSGRTREVLAALRQLTNKPVTTLINTHWHDDHVSGNEVYRAAYPDVTIIAHSTAAADLATTGVEFRRSADNKAGTIGFLRGLVSKKESFLKGPIGAEESRSHELSAWLLDEYSNGSSAFRPLTATRTVDDSLELRDGRRRIRILFLGKGHTRGDLVVHLPDEGILATGDLLMWPIQFVGSTSFPAEFAETQGRLRKLAPLRWVLPGHGKVLSAEEAQVHATTVEKMLRAMSTQTAAAVARGETLEQARKSVDLSEARHDLVGDSRLRELLFNYYVTGAGIARAYELARAGGR